ncbi:unnamed protein product [Symbiodinium natans]|uniref:Uncharacterized protein n=1 Tax=Symbiodinium natans TaxID=878477 RepID=A0A812PH21_9DINO|nr:unnamed protein product [Symbiodinium natans]
MGLLEPISSSEEFGQLFPLMPSRQPDLAMEEDDDGMPTYEGSPATHNTFESEPDIADIEADWSRRDSRSPRPSMGNYTLPADVCIPMPPNGLMHARHEHRIKTFLEDVQANPGKIKRKIERRREKAGMVDEEASTGWISQAKTKVKDFVRQIS